MSNAYLHFDVVTGVTWWWAMTNRLIICPASELCATVYLWAHNIYSANNDDQLLLNKHFTLYCVLGHLVSTLSFSPLWGLFMYYSPGVSYYVHLISACLQEKIVGHQPYAPLPEFCVQKRRDVYRLFRETQWRQSVKTRLYNTPPPYFILWNAVTSLGENKVI